MLIVGAGRGGRSLLRELRETAGEQVVGFIDDDPGLRHRRVHGVQILGTAAEIEAVLARRKPDVVFVTIPDAPRERLDFVVVRLRTRGYHVLVRPASHRPRPRNRPRARRRVSSRLRRALPVLGVFAGLAVLYVVEALLHHSPWIFFDELDYSTTARRIADLGTPPGGKAYHFNGLYPFLIAPAWLADDVHTAYWASKVIGALVMTTAVFPAYWLARMLAAPRRIALFTAAATAAVPALSYTSSLMTETLAYPYAVLCFALIVRALSSRSTGWVVGAVVAAILAPVVRRELAVIPVAFAAAALAFVAVPWLGRSWRRWAAATAVTVAGLVLAGWALKYVSTTWSAAIGNPRAMISYARSGVASVVIGVAILPAIAGLAALVPPRGERRTSERNALACLFVAAAAGFLLYTAAKGVYFGPALANPIEERNLIYLAPLFLAGTAVWLSRRAVETLALVAATAIVLWLLVTVPLQFSGRPASDAPSLEALGAIGWSDSALKGLAGGNRGPVCRDHPPAYDLAGRRRLCARVRLESGERDLCLAPVG